MNELLRKSATEQSKALKNKEISAVELTNAAFERIAELDEKLGAFNSLTEDTAIETAKKVINRKFTGVFDRGYDDNKIIDYMDDNYFIIRMNDRRNFLFKGKKKNAYEEAKKRKI